MRGLDRFFQALLAQEASFSGKKGDNRNCSDKIKDKLSQYQKNSVRASNKSGNMGSTKLFLRFGVVVVSR